LEPFSVLLKPIGGDADHVAAVRIAEGYTNQVRVRLVYLEDLRAPFDVRAELMEHIVLGAPADFPAFRISPSLGTKDSAVKVQHSSISARSTTIL